MNPYEVIAYEGETVLFKDTVLAPSKEAALFLAGKDPAGLTPTQRKDLVVVVRPFGNGK